MIFTDFIRAVLQLGDKRFRRVIWLGFVLAFFLLFAVYAGFLALISTFVGGSLTLPVIGEVTYVHELLGFASLFFMLFLSVVLMVPVASLFTGLFLDDVADAVESRHYPWLPPIPRRGFFDGLRQSLKFFGVLIVANVLALIFYTFLPFATPVIWILLNGWLLSREYFSMVAERHIEAAHVKELSRFHWLEIWFAGCLMTMPLMIPVVNLLMPVIGIATFTHLYHRLPDPA